MKLEGLGLEKEVIESLPAGGAWIEIMCAVIHILSSVSSLPAGGAWIEISGRMDLIEFIEVAPRRGSVD